MRRADLLKPDAMSEVILLGAGASVLAIVILGRESDMDTSSIPGYGIAVAAESIPTFRKRPDPLLCAHARSPDNVRSNTNRLLLNKK